MSSNTDNSTEMLSTNDYDRALELWPTELAKAALNTQIEPHWLPDETATFWYLHKDPDKHQFILVDAKTGDSREAFNHQHVADCLAGMTGTDVNPYRLPFLSFSFAKDRSHIEFVAAGKRIRCALNKTLCKPLPATNTTSTLPSPDGRHAVYVQAFNLHIRSEIDGHTQPLSDNGCEGYSYATMPDHDRMAVYRARGVLPPLPPIGVFWSPDSRHLLCLRSDDRDVLPYPLLESVPADGSKRPKIHNVRIAMAGDATRVRLDFVLFDLQGTEPRELLLPPEWGMLEINAATTSAVYWRPDSSELFTLAATPDMQRIALVAIDIATASVRIVVDEHNNTFTDFGSFEYHAPCIALLHERNAAIWYSRRSGYGHLYLVDLDNGSITPLTAGEWPVLDLIHIDHNRGQIFFTAAAIGRDDHPYYRQLIRIDLDNKVPNTGWLQLTPNGFDHAIAGQGLALMTLLSGTGPARMMSPCGNYLVDNMSTVTSPTRTVIRDRDGKLVAEIGAANTVTLDASGWVPPEPFCVHVEGLPDALHGIMIKPRNFDANSKWPVVERIYAGPQIIAQPRNFHEALTGAFVYGAYSLAELGFVVVILDGPGSPLRSQNFQDMHYENADRLGVQWHAKALQELANANPWLDQERIGINGHSWGGHASAMAMLLQPDTYKVGVSSAGVYDPEGFFTDATERYIGLPDYGAGRHIRHLNNETPVNYRRMSPSEYADRLAGRLLLAWGDLDENALPSSLLQFYESLQRAGKQVDLMYLPGRSHSLFAEPTFQKHIFDYFIEHLQGREPLRHQPLNAVMGQRPLI